MKEMTYGYGITNAGGTRWERSSYRYPRTLRKESVRSRTGLGLFLARLVGAYTRYAGAAGFGHHAWSRSS
jgi:hypothetical protein